MILWKLQLLIFGPGNCWFFQRREFFILLPVSFIVGSSGRAISLGNLVLLYPDFFSFDHWLGDFCYHLSGNWSLSSRSQGAKQKRMRVVSASGYWIPAISYTVSWFSTLSLFWSPSLMAGFWFWFCQRDLEGEREEVTVAVAHGRCECVLLGLVGTSVTGGAGIICAVSCDVSVFWFPELEWWFLWSWLLQLFSWFCLTVSLC